MIPQPRDLFGEVPVTWPEVYLWCQVVAGISGWRRDWYAEHWHVADKVATAKLDGSFYNITDSPQTPHAVATASLAAFAGLRMTSGTKHPHGTA